MNPDITRLSGSDPAGLETLELFAHAPLFNRWLYETISPYCHGSILEIGSGIGNISSFLLKKGDPVTLSDLREEYCRILGRQFGGHPNLEGVCRLDLATENFESQFPALMHHFDTIVALNVVEHIEDDFLAISNCKKMLKPGGQVIILVPAYGILFNSFDRTLGHFRRYNKIGLQKLLEKGALALCRQYYFNFAGIAGWWLSGSILKKKTIPPLQLSLFNRLVPIMRLADTLVGHKMGLSLIAIAKN